MLGDRHYFLDLQVHRGEDGGEIAHLLCRQAGAQLLADMFWQVFVLGALDGSGLSSSAIRDSRPKESQGSSMIPPHLR